jgi:hypothetical protein
MWRQYTRSGVWLFPILPEGFSSLIYQRQRIPGDSAGLSLLGKGAKQRTSSHSPDSPETAALYPFCPRADESPIPPQLGGRRDAVRDGHA